MKSKVGCILIHGFGGSVEEIEPLAERLRVQGYTVACPELAGHTGDRRDLKGVRYQDWIHSVEKNLMQVKETCEKTILIGFSMGGLIAMQLAVKHDVFSVVTINTPVYYWNFRQILRNLREDLHNRNTAYLSRYMKSSTRTTFGALLNFRLLLSRTKAIMHKVTCPIYILQALDDDTVQSRSAKYIFQHITSVNKKVEYYPRSGHLMLKSPAANKAMGDIEAFIKGL